MTDYSVPYNYYQHKWLVTKPIRGRSEDIRPIGKRRRDWETVVRIERDGVVSYGAKLYDTVCVEYFPDGAVTVRCGAWSTYSTADFISRFSPFRCWKQHNKLWIEVNGKFAPVTSEGVKLKEEPHGNEYYFAEPIVIQKSVVDRAKAKEVREPLQPFLAFAKSFLAMSDGWVMHETCKQTLGWKGDSPEAYRYAANGFMSERELYDKLIHEPSDETYVFALCCFAQVGAVNPRFRDNDRRLAERFEYEVTFDKNGRNWKSKNDFYDVHINFADLKRMLYRWTQQFNEVHKVIEVAPTDAAIRKAR